MSHFFLNESQGNNLLKITERRFPQTIPIAVLLFFNPLGACSACSLVCDAVDQVEMLAEKSGHAVQLRGVVLAKCFMPSVSQKRHTPPDYHRTDDGDHPASPNLLKCVRQL